MIPGKSIYDISVILGEQSIDYPGDTAYSRNMVDTIQKNGVCDLSRLELSAHSGTHIDTPSHFISNAKSVDQYEIDQFILPAVIIEVSDPNAVRGSDLNNASLQPGDAVLFRTNNSVSRCCCSGTFSKKFVYLSKEAAAVCVEKKLALVGIDYITIEEYGNDSFDTHKTLLKNGILVLEGIDLYHVPIGRYTLLCLPLKMKGAEASPVRAVLLN